MDRLRQPKLTRRQRSFLQEFVVLFREGRQPLHYADVALRIGVSAVTAYEMLRVLEDRGLVRSEFVLLSGGPGRSSVVFSPTEAADALVPATPPLSRDEEWEQAKERLLDAIRVSRARDYADLLDALLQRIDQPRPALLYTADLLTLALVSMHRGADRATERLGAQLRRFRWSDENGFGLLHGIVAGLYLVDQANRAVVARLLGHAEQYSRALAALSPGHRRQLLEFTREVVGLLRTRANRRSARDSSAAAPAPGTA